MYPIKAHDANGVMKAPPGETDIQDLDVKIENVMGVRVATSTWQPTEEEREKIANGEPIKLSIYGEHPPLLLWVE